MRLPSATILMRLDALSDMQKLLIHPDFLNLDDDSKVIAFAKYSMEHLTIDRQALYEVKAYLDEVYDRLETNIDLIKNFRAFLDTKSSEPENMNRGLITKLHEGLPHLRHRYADIDEVKRFYYSKINKIPQTNELQFLSKDRVSRTKPSSWEKRLGVGYPSKEDGVVKKTISDSDGDRLRKGIRVYLESLIRDDFLHPDDETFLKEVSDFIDNNESLNSFNVPFALCMEIDSVLSDKEKVRLKADIYNVTRITIPRVTKKADALDIRVSYNINESNKAEGIKGFTRAIGNFYSEATREELETVLNKLNKPYELLYIPELSNDITKPLQTTIYIRYVKKENKEDKEYAPFYTESELALTTKSTWTDKKSLFENNYEEVTRMGDEDLIKWFKSSQHVVKSLRSDENYSLIQELDILNEPVHSYSVSNYNRKRPQLFSFGLLETFGHRTDSILKDFFDYIGLKGDIKVVDNITRVRDANSVLENWIILSDSQLKQIVYHPQLSHIDINKGAVLDPRFTRLYIRQRKNVIQEQVIVNE